MISVGLEVEGLEAVQEILAGLNALGANVDAVELRSSPRTGGESFRNAQIAEVLSDNGRDFFSPTQDMINDMSRAFIANVEDAIESRARRYFKAKTEARKAAILARQDTAKSYAKLAANGLRAAMGIWIRTARERLESQRTTGGGSPKPLSESYAKFKKRKFGFETPIGIATGQLLENLSSDRIRVVRSK